MTDPLDTAFAALEPTPAARRRMRLAVLADVEAEQTSLFTLWWRLLTGGPRWQPVVALVALAVVLFTSPAVALPLALARQLVPADPSLALVSPFAPESPCLPPSPESSPAPPGRSKSATAELCAPATASL